MVRLVSSRNLSKELKATSKADGPFVADGNTYIFESELAHYLDLPLGSILLLLCGQMVVGKGGDAQAGGTTSVCRRAIWALRF